MQKPQLTLLNNGCEVKYESTRIGEEDVPQLQDRAQKRCRESDLLIRAAS